MNKKHSYLMRQSITGNRKKEKQRPVRKSKF